jgi:hypothetical protein
MLGRKARRPRDVGVNITGFLFLFFLEIGLVCVCALHWHMEWHILFGFWAWDSPDNLDSNR